MNVIIKFGILLLGVLLAAAGLYTMMFGSEDYSISRGIGIASLIVGIIFIALGYEK